MKMMKEYNLSFKVVKGRSVVETLYLTNMTAIMMEAGLVEDEGGLHLW